MSKLRNADVNKGLAVHGYSIRAGYSTVLYTCDAYGTVLESLRFSGEPKDFTVGTWRRSKRSEDDVVAYADYVGIVSCPRLVLT